MLVIYYLISSQNDKGPAGNFGGADCIISSILLYFKLTFNRSNSCFISSSVPVLERIALSLSLSMRLRSPSPVLDGNRAPMGPAILSITGARIWRKALEAFLHSRSVLDTADKFQSASFEASRYHDVM